MGTSENILGPNTLPRRDFVILPLLSLLTVVFLFGLAELTVRVAAPEVRLDSCRLPTAMGGTLFKPNCVSKTKLVDGPWVTNEYNECGYRTRASCGPKPPGTIRIAVLGTSAATGFMVSYDRTVWGIVERELSRDCRRPVEVQNLAIMGSGPVLAQEAARMDEALALQPDLVVLMASGGDLDGLAGWHPSEQAKVPSTERKPQGINEYIGAAKMLLWHSAVITGARYILYRDDDTYLKVFLSTQGDGLGHLQVPFPASWRQRIATFDSLLAGMSEKAQAQGVPFVLVPSLFRGQMLLLRSGTQIPGIDPYVYDLEAAKLAQKYNVVKFDIYDDFRRIPKSDGLFYVADGHFTAEGHAIFARAFLRQLSASHLLERVGCSISGAAPQERMNSATNADPAQPSAVSR